MRAPRQCCYWVIWLLCSCAPTVVRAACDPVSGEARVLARYQIDLEGTASRVQALTLPARGEVGVVLQEQGIDATLEVHAGSNLIERADNPIRRTGNQRVLWRPQAGQVYAAHVVGKEPRVRGRVELLLIVLPEYSQPSACVTAHRALALAERHYAAGQQITNGVVTAEAGRAAREYADTASALAQAIAAAGNGPALMLAQLQHAAAANFYQGVRNYPQAARTAAAAAATYADVGDGYGRARAVAMHAAAVIQVGYDPVTETQDQHSQDRVRQLLEPVIAFHAARGETYDQALATNNLGIAYYNDGRLQQAIAAYQQALQVYGAQERLRRNQVMGNLALVEHELGQLSSALQHFEAVLRELTIAESPTLYVGTLNNSALANYTAANIDTALEQYQEALRLARRIQDPFSEAVSLHGLAAVYALIGENVRALELAQQALSLRTVDLGAARRADSLAAIAVAMRKAGQPRQALQLHREALSLASEPVHAAYLHVEIAADLAALGELAKAEQELSVLLEQRSPGDALVRAYALLERSEQRMARGIGDAVARDLHKSLQVFTTFDAADLQFRTLLALARESLAQQPQAADRYLDRALDLAETLRSRIANVEFRAQRLQQLRPAFDLKIQLLAARYFRSSNAQERARLAAALVQTADRARARALVDFARLELQAPAVDTALLQRREALYRALATCSERLAEAAVTLPADGPRMSSIRTELAELRRELEKVEGQAARLANREGRGPRSLGDQLARLPSDVAVIEYWLGEQQALAWTVTRDGITITRLAAPTDITASATSFTRSLRGLGRVPQAARLRAASQLAQLIWQPLQAQLANRRTLVFIPDRVLHEVPFAALRDASQRFLVADHDIATTPSFGTLLRGLNPQPRLTSPRLLLVDDPVFTHNDPRLGVPIKTTLETPWRPLRAGSTTRSLVRLPATAREATAVAALLPGNQVMRLQGLAATKQRFLTANLTDFSHIHVATHATVDQQIPQLSALVLTSVNDQGRDIDGRVLAADLVKLRLNADLVVLSACDTALGKELGAEGLIGLRYVTLARGARTVAASLWSVPDAVAELQMQQLYASLFSKRASPVHALSEAMRSLQAQLGDPALWSAFEMTIGGMDGLVPTD